MQLLQMLYKIIDTPCLNCFSSRCPVTMRNLVCPLVEDFYIVTMAMHLSNQDLSLPVRLHVALFSALSERVVILYLHFFHLRMFKYICLWILHAGLTGSTNRSSGADIKREDKEDDENCSITDRSEDDKKDLKPRLGTRCLKPLFFFSSNIYT